MKLRTSSRLKAILIPAIAAFLLGASAIGCSSSGEQAEPDAAMAAGEDGAANNTNADPLANDANAANGDNAALAANGAPANAAPTNGAPTNAAGTELQNAAADNGSSAPPADAGANPAVDPFANGASGSAGANAMPVNGAPVNGAPLNGAPPADGNLGSGDAGLNAGGNAQPPADGALAGTDMGALPANGSTNAIPPPPETDALAAAPADVAPVTDAAPAPETPAETASAPASSGTSEGSAGPSSGMVPESGSKMAYYVVKGDSLAVISKKIFGSQGKWKTLANDNNIVDPNKIYAGDVIFYTVDDSARDFAQKYESAARQSVTVAAGDTLSKISLKVYGTEGAWRTLWKENPQVKNPDVVSVGMVLSFRGGQASAAIEQGNNNEETAQTEEVSAQ